MSILRPKINVLDREHKNQIYAEAKEILTMKGILMENQDAITLFENEGS